MKRICIILLIIWGGNKLIFSQQLSNIRHKQIIVSDSTSIDTLSIIPFSETFLLNGELSDTSKFTIDYFKGVLICKDKLFIGKKLDISYRVFRFNLSKPFPKKTITNYIDTQNNELSHKILHGYELSENSYQDNEIITKGSISRGIGVGNNQNLAVNSEMNLQITGKIANNISIDAVLTDNNIPIQPDGHTQKIQDFDQVYIRLYDSLNILQIGDIDINNSKDFFLRFNRKTRGVNFKSIDLAPSKPTKLESSTSMAISKGNFNKLEFKGANGVQGPYKLTGANNESYVIVLAGSEKVYIDGEELKRGENADYVMNYNAAELIFTINRLITDNSRIVVEYEYSVQNYNRFLLHTQNRLKFKRGSIGFSYLNESDAKNQPIIADLNSQNKSVLSQAGDNPSMAVVPNIDSLEFNVNIISYKMVDTIVNSVLYDSVLVQSYNPKIAFYRAGFALVGTNKGNYIKLTNAANGKVFKWIAPVGSVPQGEYEPVQVLTAPEKTQLFVINGNIALNEKTNLFTEVALSDKDLNTFSAIDNYDNKGVALKNGINRTFYLKNSTLLSSLNYERVSKYFNPLQSFRNIEFKRDWNLNTPFVEDEDLLQASVKWFEKKTYEVTLQQEMLNYKNKYTGYRSILQGKVRFYDFLLYANANLLNSKSDVLNSQFYRHKIKLSRNVYAFNTGVINEYENNLITHPLTDSLLNSSQKFNLAKAYLRTSDTLKQYVELSYSYRNDYLPMNNKLYLAFCSKIIELKSRIVKQQSQRLTASIISHKRILKSVNYLTKIKPDNSLLAKLDHSVNLRKRWLVFSTYYETGMGMENKKEFAFLEVAMGKGVYEWHDFNDNGIQEIDEFDVSLNKESANYVKIYTPTNDYIRVYTLKAAETFRFEPSRIWRNKSGVKGVISRFSNILACQINKKQTENTVLSRINPFQKYMNDTVLLHNSESLRNTFSFNKTNTVFGTDYVLQISEQKTLLTNGFDKRQNKRHELKMRWNFASDFTFVNVLGMGKRSYNSEFFSYKNYELDILDNALNIQWQPTPKFRTLVFYNAKSKNNILGIENVLLQETGSEIKINSLNQGIVSFKASVIINRYNGKVNSSLGYLLLESLQPGVNYRWSVNISRNINNFLRLNANYQARKPANRKTIHTGQISLSAYF